MLIELLKKYKIKKKGQKKYAEEIKYLRAR